MKLIQVSENILQIEGIETKIKIVKCQFCGKSFIFVPGNFGHEEKKYCSKKCMMHEKWRRSNLVRQGKMGKRVFSVCPICKIEFKITKPSQKYCSETCVYEAKKIRNRIQEEQKQEQSSKGKILGGACKNCNRDFFYIYNGKIKEFCSSDCRSDFFNKVNKERYWNRKNLSKNPKTDESELIPLPTFLEMTQKKVKEVVDYINQNRIYYHRKDNEWWVTEKLFDVFPVVKTLEAL